MNTLDANKSTFAIHAELVDRRESDRTQSAAENAYVWVSLNARFEASMQDQSTGGLSVLAPAEGFFEVGFQIRVEVKPKCYRMARIVHVADYNATKVRLGLAWED